MKVLNGFDSKYAVTEDGRVYSFASKTFLKPQVTGKGYLTVQLGRGRNYKPYRVHRLVAEAFIPNPDNLPEVNHIDEDKTNNSVDNLEWCTRQYNLNYGTGRQRAREKVLATTRAKFGKPIYCVELGKTFSCASEAATELHIKDERIRFCCKGRRKTAGGYHWQYV